MRGDDDDQSLPFLKRDYFMAEGRSIVALPFANSDLICISEFKSGSHKMFPFIFLTQKRSRGATAPLCFKIVVYFSFLI